MTDTDVYYFGAKALLMVGTATLAAVKGVEFVTRFDFVEAWDNSSILMGDVSRTKARVEGKLKYGKFNSSVANDWRQGILSPTGTTYTIEDTNEVKKFTIAGTFTPKGGGNGRIGTITDAYFEADPWITTEDQYMVSDLSFKGRQIVWADVV